jgi:hypothetical protein
MTDRARESALQEAAIAALRRGDAAVARAALHDMAAPPPMLLAQACNRTGDWDGEAAALRRILREQPRDLPALLAMAGRQRAGAVPPWRKPPRPARRPNSSRCCFRRRQS